MPEEYTLFQAAKWMGVAAWDLAERPTFWRDWALTFMEAEGQAREQLAKRAQRKSAQRR